MDGEWNDVKRGIPVRPLLLMILAYNLEAEYLLLLQTSRQNEVLILRWLDQQVHFSEHLVASALVEACKYSAISTARWLSSKLDVYYSRITERQEILNLIEIDKKHRYKGVTDDLFTFDQLNLDRYTIDEPGFPPRLTSCHIQKNRKPFRTLAAYREFANTQIYSLLQGFDRKGMIAAGGAVCQALHQTPKWQYNDLDFFLVGLTEEEAKNKINALADHLYLNQIHNRSAGGRQLMVQRTQRCITFGIISRNGLLISTPIQVVLRLFSTISEVLHCFDLGSSAIADDGTNLYFSSLGKFAQEIGYNILDLSRRQASYEYRIQKYMNRGFGLIVPDLDLIQIACDVAVREKAKTSDRDNQEYQKDQKDHQDHQDQKDHKQQIEKTTISLHHIILQHLDVQPATNQIKCDIALTRPCWKQSWYDKTNWISDPKQILISPPPEPNVELHQTIGPYYDCVCEIYRLGMDVTTLQPRSSIRYLFQSCFALYLGTPLFAKDMDYFLQSICTPEEIQDVIQYFSREDKNIADKTQFIQEKIEEKEKLFGDPFIPFQFSPIGLDGQDIGFNQVFKCASITQEEWYGKWIR